jgi:hypothetical protein
MVGIGAKLASWAISSPGLGVRLGFRELVMRETKKPSFEGFFNSEITCRGREH